MKFLKTEIMGLFIVELETHNDERGFFARTFCPQEFKSRGLNPQLDQCSLSYNKHAGTLRGIHYQIEPFEEAKLVRCSRGKIFDVCVDLRSDSPTFLHHVTCELDSEMHRALYIPEGCGHGFQTLVDQTEVFYQISSEYAPQASRGLRYDDPGLAIDWPFKPSVISEKDLSYPLIETLERR